MPDLIRHPETFEKTGFRLEFAPLEKGAGMTTFVETVGLWTDTKYIHFRFYLPANS
jgi:hypothetical protein